MSDQAIIAEQILIVLSPRVLDGKPMIMTNVENVVDSVRALWGEGETKILQTEGGRQIPVTCYSQHDD